MNLVENLKETLKKREYKLTTQRKIIFDVFVENDDAHLSPEEIYDIVKDNHPEIGLATVYRTLQIFDEIGIVKKMNFNDGCSRYELMDEDESEHHCHLICTKCSRVIEIDDKDLENISDVIENEEEYAIKEYNIKFFGVCKECSE
ncbi:MAG: transcriptional repressor [Tissierellales bacterium]|jgi:Fur family ferric uptake transcriptional regulator|nr:transcriptional repressor [Tissierellales bacterium]